MTRAVRSRRASGFTLVELLVTITLLLLIGVMLMGLLTESQKTWMQSARKIEAYRESRVAFESISRDLAQAALHSYWDYDQPDNPRDYVRRSELRFISGPGILSSEGSGRVRGITHSVFFQAPLGRTSDSRYQGLETMFNSCGFFIEYGSDSGYRPDFFDGRIEAKNRFRLMQWVQPAENWDLFNWTSGNPGYKGRNWYGDHAQGENTQHLHILAENVIALVLLPRLPETVDSSGTALAPNYLYDSAPSTWPPARPQSDTENQLPPIIQATLVTLDEASAARLEDLTDDPVEFLGLDGLFRIASEFEEDLQSLKDSLQSRRLHFRVFQSAVQLKSR